MRSVYYWTHLFAITAFAIGCSEPDPGFRHSLVGKWGESVDAQSASQGVTIQFESTGEFQIALPYNLDGKSDPITMHGKWTLDGSKMLLQPSATNQPGVSLRDMRWKIQSIEPDRFEYVTLSTGDSMTYFRME